MKNPENRNLRRLIFKSLLIVFILFIIDYGIGKTLKFLYFRQVSGFSYRTTYSVDTTKAEVIILGSSRANHNYVPGIFEDSLHCSSYNAGKDGSFVLYSYAIFKSITKRYCPKIIIVDIRPGDMNYNKTEYERLSLLLPYYQTHPEIRQIVDLRGPFEKVKLLSKIYPFNSMIFQIAVGNLQKDNTNELNKGYVPLFKTMQNEKMDSIYDNTPNIDKNKMRCLKDIVSTCSEKGIDLVFVYSPIWIKIKDPDKNILSEFCSENGLKYIDMSNDPFFLNNQKYFADYNHLNDEGARIFSSVLINRIMKTNSH
jgi:hypothetical protein